MNPELLALFKTEVTDRSSEIDPGEEHDWLSLSIGWAIAKGLSPAETHEFALHLRYSTNLA